MRSRDRDSDYGRGKRDRYDDGPRGRRDRHHSDSYDRRSDDYYNRRDRGEGRGYGRRGKGRDSRDRYSSKSDRRRATPTPERPKEQDDLFQFVKDEAALKDMINKEMEFEVNDRKDIIIYFTANWSQDCKEMENDL